MAVVRCTSCIGEDRLCVFWREKVEKQSHGGSHYGVGDVKYNENKLCTKKNTGLDNSFAIVDCVFQRIIL